MKKKLFVFLLMIIFFGTIQPVNAARQICTRSRLSEFKTKAYQITANYELHTSENELYYFTITFSNVQPGIVGTFLGSSIKYEEGKDLYTMSAALDGGKTYEAKFYVDEKNVCAGEYLYTKRITIPKYNKYSERSECIEYEEFYLCNKWYQKDIKSLDYFLEELEKYKESIKKKPPEKLDKDDRNIFEKIADFYSDNITITGPLTIIAIAGLGYYTYKKYDNRKKRAKIKY